MLSLCDHCAQTADHPHNCGCACHTPQGTCAGRGKRRGARVFDAGTLRYLVLQHIAYQPRHGYEIIKAISEQSGGAYNPSPGMIYPLLTMLEELGHITAIQQGNKKQYVITPQGRGFLAENLDFVAAIENRLQTKRCHANDLIQRNLQALEQALRIRIRDHSVSPATKQAIDHIIAQAIQAITDLPTTL